MAKTLIIHPRKFYSRRWEFNRFWAREAQRKPLAYEDDGITEADRQAEYDHFKALDMVMPESRSGWVKMVRQAKRGMCDRLTKRVHWEKFNRDLMQRVHKAVRT